MIIVMGYTGEQEKGESSMTVGFLPESQSNEKRGDKVGGGKVRVPTWVMRVEHEISMRLIP